MTGASGTASKLVRVPPWTESTRAGEDDVDLAVEVGDQVGERVAGGAQVDRAFQGLVEQRGDRLGEAVDRGFGAGVGCELNPGADRLDVGGVEELRMRQGYLGFGDVGVGAAFGVGQRCRQRRVVAALGAAFELQGKSLGLKPRLEQPPTWKRF